MRSFDEIFEISATRHGGPNTLEQKLVKPKSAKGLAQVPDDRWLAQMTRSVFQAGFNWKVVDAMWPGFEKAFKGFDIGTCALMDDDWFDRLVTDTSIVRYPAKIMSVRDNAAFLSQLAREHGSAAKALADWPSEDFAGLLAMLKKDGNRLGGSTGQYFLRFMERDGYILSRDVVGRLEAEGVIDKAPTSKKAMAAVQDAFNRWMDQSGRSLTEISRVLAMSTG